jgi:hypothetical protein
VTLREIIEAVRKEKADYRTGPRVTNCVLHAHLPFASRPHGCALCWTDINNQLSLAVRVNADLNGMVDRILAADSPPEGK